MSQIARTFFGLQPIFMLTAPRCVFQLCCLPNANLPGDLGAIHSRLVKRAIGRFQGGFGERESLHLFLDRFSAKLANHGSRGRLHSVQRCVWLATTVAVAGLSAWPKASVREDAAASCRKGACQASFRALAIRPAEFCLSTADSAASFPVKLASD